VGYGGREMDVRVMFVPEQLSRLIHLVPELLNLEKLEEVLRTGNEILYDYGKYVVENGIEPDETLSPNISGVGSKGELSIGTGTEKRISFRAFWIDRNGNYRE
jgi:hypothetical protein